MSTIELPSKFHVPLHVHTEFSLLDGHSKVKDICKKAADNNMPGLAITDHGTMFGMYAFYYAAKDAGIKPILGCEVYVVNGDHLDKSKRTKLYHLVLLAKNDNGYKNLIKIVSEGCIKGFYYKPRVSKDFIRQYSEDIIALSACLGGEVNNSLLNGKKDIAREAALEYKDIFGENFYLEIQDHKQEEDRIVNPLIVELGQELGIKVVATNDSHYTNPEDAKSHDALLCLQMQKYISDFPRMRFTATEYLKTGEEMASMFQDHLDYQTINKAVFTNTMEIFNQIEDYDSFANPGMHLPEPETEDGLSIEDYLKKLTYDGAIWRFGEVSEEVDHRLEHELKIMYDSGFASYFIVVWDFISWAREQNIPVGPGRGSAAGSLVAYCLGITNIDPLKYDLLFERFLNPERKSMPDIDTDFCIERREEVINYVREKYGESNVCQIITFNRLTSRSVLKDMARVLEYPFARAERLAKMIDVVRGKPRKLSWMIENHDEFKSLYNSEPDTKEVVDLALKNEGLNKTYGVHAAGVIIANKEVTDVIPTARSNDGGIITQFPMEECGELGLLKMDFLGLRNLTMIQKAVDIINSNKTHDEQKLDIKNIAYDDDATFKTIASGELSGIFQLETSAGMKQVARDLAPESLEDVSALIALYRPGPLDTGMIDDFIERKSGKQTITYDHPLLEPILRNTYGTIVYQEQIMQIAQALGGFTLGEADMLRRAMGKKKPEVLMPFKAKFVDGCLANKNTVPKEVSEKLFEQMLAFAEYCFNKSHSTAYGFVTYQTAYLKTHYPIEYLTALMISCDGEIDKLKNYLIEAQRLQIKVKAPNVNESDLDFTCDIAKKEIVFGLKAIKGVGSGPCKSLIAERQTNGHYQTFYDLCERIDHKTVNKRTLEGLIKSGAMDCLNAGRKAMVENLEAFINAAKKSNNKASTGQLDLFSQMNAVVETAPKYIISENDEYNERELQHMEYTLLGLFVTKHPMKSIDKICKLVSNLSINKAKNLNDKSKVRLPALITSFVKKITKSKKIICIVNLEDVEDRIEGVIFSKHLAEMEHLLENGKRVLIVGSLSKHSEGNSSIMIEKMEDLDGKSIINIPIEVNKLKDYFAFFHSLRALLKQNDLQGDSFVTLELNHEGNSKQMSLGPEFTVSQTAPIQERINQLLEQYST